MFVEGGESRLQPMLESRYCGLYLFRQVIVAPMYRVFQYFELVVRSSLMVMSMSEYCVRSGTCMIRDLFWPSVKWTLPLRWAWFTSVAIVNWKFSLLR